MKIIASAALLSPLLFTSSCAIEQSRFEAAANVARQALLRGELKEALASYETQAVQAEKSATTSSFPQQYLESAYGAYLYASSAARLTGQLQKSITYAEKAHEIARRVNGPIYNLVNPSVKNYPPVPELDAMLFLITSYVAVRDFDKARGLIEKGLELVQQISPNSEMRVTMEDKIYAELGSDFIRRGAYDKAIDAYSHAVSLRQAQTSRVTSGPALQHTRVILVHCVISLGSVYRQAGKFDNALDQYQQAFDYIQLFGLRHPGEYYIHAGIGEVYIQQKDFTRALESYQKALTLAETQRLSSTVGSLSVRIE